MISNMKYIFQLSGENLKLAKEEVLSIADNKRSILIEKLLIIDLDDKTKIINA